MSKYEFLSTRSNLVDFSFFDAAGEIYKTEEALQAPAYAASVGGNRITSPVVNIIRPILYPRKPYYPLTTVVSGGDPVKYYGPANIAYASLYHYNNSPYYNFFLESKEENDIWVFDLNLFNGNESSSMDATCEDCGQRLTKKSVSTYRDVCQRCQLKVTRLTRVFRLMSEESLITRSHEVLTRQDALSLAKHLRLFDADDLLNSELDSIRSYWELRFRRCKGG